MLVAVEFGNVYTCGPEPATLILEPDEATNVLPTGTSHQFTATVLDQYGDPMAGVLVSFSTDFGHFEGDDKYVEVLTNASDQASVTVVSTTAGVAHIRAWVDDGGDGLPYGVSPDSPAGQEATTLATVLDDYNNGLIGPGHCDGGAEEEPPRHADADPVKMYLPLVMH